MLRDVTTNKKEITLGYFSLIDGYNFPEIYFPTANLPGNYGPGSVVSMVLNNE